MNQTTSAVKPRVFSGIQPTGALHLGNYVGALSQWVAQQHERDSIFCVVDLHALTVPEEVDPARLRDQVRSAAAIYFAAGIDPESNVVFVQSAVREHTELTWLLNCVTPLGWLYRMTQFKAKSEGRESVGTGLLDYPVLMAADILAYDTDEVPIGDDQRQHLELARDVAVRFNHRFGDTLVVPRGTFPGVAARVMDLQNPTAKMSKSSESPQGTLLLLDPPAVLTKKIRSAVTDSGSTVRYAPEEQPGVSNLLEILGAATGRSVGDWEAELDGRRYGDLKNATAEAVVELLAPLQERYATLAADPGEVDRILAAGAAKAESVAAGVLGRVRDALGLLPKVTG